MFGSVRGTRTRPVALILCTMLLCAVHDVAAEVSVDVVTDRAILPIAELASTQTDPDVVVLGNNKLEVTLVPNRGRVVAELRSNEGTEFLHFVDKPVPFKGAQGVEIVEFGGFYSSIPWNSRVRQPYNLDYEIVDRGPDRAEVVITGLDILTRVSVEWHVVLEDGSDTVSLTASYTNRSSRTTQSVEATHLLHLRPAEGWFNQRRLISDIDEVTVIASEGDWLGSRGSAVRFSRIEEGWTGDGSFCVVGPVSSEGDAVAWFDRRSRSAIRWSWGPGGEFTDLEICGNPDFVQLKLSAQIWTLQPGETRRINHDLSVVSGLRRNPSIED